METKLECATRDDDDAAAVAVAAVSSVAMPGHKEQKKYLFMALCRVQSGRARNTIDR